MPNYIEILGINFNIIHFKMMRYCSIN